MTVPAEEAPANFVPAARGNTKGASVVRNYWALKRAQAVFQVSGESQSSTLELPLKLEN